MKAMVLAAGLGTRMRPLTRLVAKPALPMLNRPLLHFTLERLRRAGVREVMVNTHHLPRSVRRAVGDGARLGVRVSYSHEPEILGTGGGPRRVRRFFGDEPLLLVNGDIWFDADLRALVRRHLESGARATLGLRPNPAPRRYPPVVSDRAGHILSLRGKPRAARGIRSLFAGVQVLEPELLERLPAGFSDIVGDLYIPLLRAGERLCGVRLRGAWYDLGDPSLYLAAQMKLLRRAGRDRSLIDPSARVAKDAAISASVIGPQARIGSKARVERSVVFGSSSVAAGARVRNSILAGRVRVAAGARVEDAVLTPVGRGRL